MSTVDRILELLDQAGQRTGEQAYGDFDRGTCWRCQGPPGEGTSGVCNECRVVLLDETVAPAPSRVGFRTDFVTCDDLPPTEPITLPEFAQRYVNAMQGRSWPVVAVRSQRFLPSWDCGNMMQLIGGPRHGEWMALPPGQDRIVVALFQPLGAYRPDDDEPLTPEIRTGVYLSDPLRHALVWHGPAGPAA